MATEVKELPQRNYKIDSSGQRSFQRTWRVTFDTPDQLAYQAVDEIGIARGQIYHTCYLNEISSDQDSEDGRDFKVTASYGAYVAATPLDEPVQREWKFDPKSQIVERDVFGNPIFNSARDPFADPVEIDRTRMTLTLTRNEPGFDYTLAYEYCNSINATPFYGAPPGCVKLSDVSSSYTVYPSLPEGGYWTTSYTFQFDINGFDKVLLDRGFRKLVSGKKQNILIQGQPISEAILLDGEGQPLPEGDDILPIYGQFFVYPRLPYYIFNF